MVTRTGSLIGRTLAFALAVTSIGVWMFPAVAAYGQTSSPAAPAVKPEQPTRPAAPAESTETPAGSHPPVTPASTASRANCERYVRVLAGRDKDPALLKQADVKAMAARAAELVTCGAVLADSDEVCELLDKDQAGDCRRTRSTFHELRAYPNGRSFMFDEAKFQECKQNAVLAPLCDTLRKALRSGDANQCAMHADFDAICRTLNDIDVSKCATEAPKLQKMLEGQCRAKVTLDESACDIPGPRREEMAKQCRQDIAARKAYGKGLKELAKSGSPREREFAKAALRDPDACKTLTQSAMDACLGTSSAPAPAGATPTSGGTDTTVPEAPKATTSSPPATALPTP